MWVGGVLKARIPFEAMGKNLSPFPYVLMLGQDDNERILGEHLAQLGPGRPVEHGTRRARAACGSCGGNDQESGQHSND
jgi:hypothetical protein